MLNTDIDEGIKLWIVNDTYGPDLSFTMIMQRERYLLKMDEDFGDESNSESLTHDDEFEEDDSEFCATTTVHLPIPDMPSHFTTILDDEIMKT